MEGFPKKKIYLMETEMKIYSSTGYWENNPQANSYIQVTFSYFEGRGDPWEQANWFLSSQDILVKSN